jgi:hypothetical protein
MTILVLLAVLLFAALGLFALVGYHSRAIFTRPHSLSDAQVEAVVDLTRRIMDRAPPGSASWTRAAARHKAAVDEQLRRKGEMPFDNVEIVEPR